MPKLSGNLESSSFSPLCATPIGTNQRLLRCCACTATPSAELSGNLDIRGLRKTERRPSRGIDSRKQKKLAS
jgi:hypothetical protein